MLDGFRAVVPNGGDIVISQESATYRPEMEWLATRLKETHSSRSIGDDTAQYEAVGLPSKNTCACPQKTMNRKKDGAVYRFFELFDLPNIPEIDKALRANA